MTDTPAQEATPATPAPAADDATARLAILEKELSEARKEAAKYRTERKAQEAEAQKRAEDEATAKGEFERLAKERGDKLAKLEPEHTTLNERYTALVELIEKQAQGRIRALPEEIRAMKPDGDVTTLLDWLGKAEAAAAKLATQRSPGTPPGPRGTGGDVQPAPAGDITAQKRASVDYAL